MNEVLTLLLVSWAGALAPALAFIIVVGIDAVRPR